MSKIITIGREFGSGGRELGRRLAQKLGIEYYDREIITEIANHTSLSEEYVQQIIESKPHHLYPITVGRTFSYMQDYMFWQAQSVISAQFDIIKKMAEKSDCVIVGRCADYILKEENPFRIFVYADLDARVKRCVRREENDMSEKEIKKQIKAVDKNRAQFYNYFVGEKWGDKKNYDLCINTTKLDIKEVAEILSKML